MCAVAKGDPCTAANYYFLKRPGRPKRCSALCQLQRQRRRRLCQCVSRCVVGDLLEAAGALLAAAAAAASLWGCGGDSEDALFQGRGGEPCDRTKGPCRDYGSRRALDALR